MALGFDVILVGVHALSYRDQILPAWRRDPPWFDGWALAKDPRIRQCDADQLMGVLTPKEARELQAQFSRRVRTDGSIAPTATDLKIISEDPLSNRAPDFPAPPKVEELDKLLAEPKLKWVIVHLWDVS